MKKWISLLFVTVLILFANIGGASAAVSKKAAAAPTLYLDGKVLQAKVPPVMSGASVLVPIRTVAENLGYKVSFDNKKKIVSVKQASTLIQMTLNNKKANVNGKSVILTEPPKLQSDTTLIPIRFVGETLGLQIMWDNSSKSAFLYTDAAPGGTGSGNGTGSVPAAGTGSGTGAGTGTGTPATPDPGAGTGTTPTPVPGTGTGTGIGSQTGTTPPDGGLIGVVEGPDGNGSAGGTGDQTGAGQTTPTVIPAHLHQIRYEPDAVVITYDGLTAPTTSVFSGPDRIVIDLPNADFAADFTADQTPMFTNGPPAVGQIAELAVTGHEALQKIRFSQYQDNPNTVRVVLDLNKPWGYDVKNDALNGELRINLKKPETSQPGKSGYTIVLDAGHGGSDPGAASVTGHWEKEFNLSVVLKVKALLENDPRINLVLTRESDVYPTLDDRVNLANSLKADLFLSVHANSYTKATNGTETYYTRANSQAFARLLHKNAVAATGFKDNGVRTANFKVIKYTTMPAVLLESGYLTNDSDGPQLFTDALQNRVAAAIATSFKQYFNLQ
jgi:N-acetylmuramoyl-L-alanine amidase